MAPPRDSETGQFQKKQRKPKDPSKCKSGKVDPETNRCVRAKMSDAYKTARKAKRADDAKRRGPRACASGKRNPDTGKCVRKELTREQKDARNAKAREKRAHARVDQSANVTTSRGRRKKK